MFRRFIAMLRYLGLTRLATILVAVSCGNRDPVPVGVDLVDRLSGETIELAPALPSQASTRFEGLLPIVRGISGELMVGRSNGIVYSALLRVPQDSLSGIQGELAAANLRLTLNPGQQRGLGQFALFQGDAPEIATANDTARPHRRTGRIHAARTAVIIACVPVLDPLGDVAGQVERAVGALARGERADRRQPRVAVLRAPKVGPTGS